LSWSAATAIPLEGYRNHPPQLAEVADAARDALRTQQPELLSRLFFEAAADAVVIINEGGEIVHLNTQAEKVFGYRRDELLNQPIEILVPERLRVQHVKHRRAYFKNPLPRAMGGGFRGAGLRKDGTEFPIDIALSPLLTASGVFVASAVRDMTFQQRLEQELRQRMRELEDVDRHKDEFLMTLAHELSSPLAAVAYCAELLQQSRTAPGVRAEAGKIVLEEIGFLRRLLEDLGELPRIRRGEVPVHKAPTNIAEVARLAADISSPLIQRHQLVLELVVPPSSLEVHGDAARLVQVVTNLLTNAARYTPEGGRICLSIEREDGAAILKVKDNGIGIPKEMLTRVFDLFTRLDGAKQRYASGKGIGLALARRLVEVQGGSLEAFSEGDGKGSEFVVRLPLAREAPPTGST
jgi:protein-histidine pros-kinase